ncbi:hypothetical protein F503_02643 [Ophiostoma piceae UAMH 11346]|uniref:Uncharacterized protein n=1 Tax=Ophiostoma piceae (strain UAMH 11346) TaxID=1262450 RepID=S3CZV1_OPHP1|nr:hypothetical protein F503_02643 [Ophiostoma piceae UAMH 11346]
MCAGMASCLADDDAYVSTPELQCEFSISSQEANLATPPRPRRAIELNCRTVDTRGIHRIFRVLASGRVDECKYSETQAVEVSAGTAPQKLCGKAMGTPRHYGALG